MSEKKQKIMTRNSLQLTHSQAHKPENNEEYDRGYSKGWWQQPLNPDTSDDFKRGYRDGYNDKSMDAN